MNELNENERKILLAKRRAWKGGPPKLPHEVSSYPTMLTREELRMLYWLTSSYYAGEGAICDLGSFLGGSTMALASGYLSAGHKDACIHSYDRHRIGPALWEKYKLDQSGREFPEDGNFLELTKEMLGEALPVVNIHSGDFVEMPSPTEPIEILFVDIMKTPETCNRVISTYYPKLIPGRSIVVQQDYFHPWPVWDVATTEMLSDYFEVISFTEQNSALLLNTRKIPHSILEEAANIHDIGLQQARQLVRRASKRWFYAKQRYDLYKIELLIEAGGNKPLSERKGKGAKQLLAKVTHDYARFEELYLLD